MITTEYKFTNSEGIKLVGILDKSDGDISTCVILCHGITVDKEEGGVFTNLSLKLVNNGLAAFRFDYRGHGESGGNSIDMSVTGEYSDLRSTVEFVKDLGYENIIIVGASFACGSVALYLTKEIGEVLALVLWNPVIDYSSFLSPTLPWARKYFGENAEQRIRQHGYTEVGSSEFKIGEKLFRDMKVIRPWELLLDVDLPVLFVHGDKDSYVPYDDSKVYSDKMKNAKLITIKGSEHGFSEERYEREAINATVKFCINHQHPL